MPPQSPIPPVLPAHHLQGEGDDVSAVAVHGDDLPRALAGNSDVQPQDFPTIFDEGRGQEHPAFSQLEPIKVRDVANLSVATCVSHDRPPSAKDPVPSQNLHVPVTKRTLPEGKVGTSPQLRLQSGSADATRSQGGSVLLTDDDLKTVSDEPAMWRNWWLALQPFRRTAFGKAVADHEPGDVFHAVKIFPSKVEAEAQAARTLAKSEVAEHARYLGALPIGERP